MTIEHSHASVSTDRPARYGKQLASHLNRRAKGTWDSDSQVGAIEFEGGRADLSCDEGALSIELATEPGKLDILENVVGRHLVRFGTRDELVVSWVRADGSPGSEQRNTGDDDGHTGPPGAASGTP